MKNSLIALALGGSLLAACGRAPAPAQPEPVDGSTAAEAEYLEEVAAELEPAREESAVALPPLPIDHADFDLPIHDNARVRFWLDVYQGRAKSRFTTWLSRKSAYEPMIRERLRARGLPEDLVYLALVESGFETNAVSRAKAVGMWQFMQATARGYGLEVSDYVDERRDPVRATEAAVAYLTELYRRFGSWYLAAAAYNSGETRIERLLREHAGGARGDDALFWQIEDALPKETRDYVPMIVAAAIAGKYPERFGFDGVKPQSPADLAVVTIPEETDLKVVARLTKLSVEEVQRLNPHLRRTSTPPGRQVRLYLPAAIQAEFATAYASLAPEQRMPRATHVVQAGETLSRIAVKYGTTVAVLRELNDIADPNTVRTGRKLRLPAGEGTARTVAAGDATKSSATEKPETAAPKNAPGATAVKTAPASTNWQGPNGQGTNGQGTNGHATPAEHVVRAGESLWNIARAAGVTVEDLRRWNRLEADAVIQPGQKLRLSGQRVVIYTVQSGDTLSGIAKKHGVTVADLLGWNRLGKDAVIRPGDEVEVRLTE